MEGYFINDSLDGEVKGYYMNGLPMYVKHYRVGARQGSAISYFDNGKVEQIANFDEDLPDGAVISYYPDSILRYVKEYKKGCHMAVIICFIAMDALPMRITTKMASTTVFLVFMMR